MLTAVQNEHKSHQKDCSFYKKMFFLKLFFPDEHYLYTNGLFYILATYTTCILLQFLSGEILMLITIHTGVQNGRIDP